MAFQINVLEDGQWVTQSTSLESQWKEKTAVQPNTSEPDMMPRIGVMNRTIINSPIVRTILPARIRMSEHNDMVFVGDHYIRVCEIREDGQLYEIAEKSDFQHRILHAKIIGTYYEPEVGTIRDTNSLPISSAILDKDAPCRGELPPQILVLFLDSHEYVFIFVGSRNGKPEFVCSRYESPATDITRAAGFHLAVDPHSRYMATAFSKSGFCIFELLPFAKLREQYTNNEPLAPVRSWRPRVTNGYVLKMDFLYPRSTDPNCVILVLVIATEGRTKISIYQWQDGQDLKEALKLGQKGFTLPITQEIPVHLIPLTVKSAFCLVTQTTMSVCEDILHSNPTFQTIIYGDKEPTPWHNGLKQPMWCQWSRPHRRKAYYLKQDNVYVAREDGIVIFLDFQPGEIIATSVEMGSTHLSTNIDTAFAISVVGGDDAMVIGGDCGNGSVWMVPPRKDIKKASIISNWAPCIDAGSSDEFESWNQPVSYKKSLMIPWYEPEEPNQAFQAPDRLYTASGRGSNGTITEHRVGIAANIGIEFEYTPAKKAWVFPNPSSGSDDTENPSMLVLISVRDSSEVLSLTPRYLEDPELTQLEPHETFFDLSHSTLAAGYTENGRICQVTEQSIVFNNVKVTLAAVFGIPDLKAENASIGHGLVALSVQTHLGFKICLAEIDGEVIIPRGQVSLPSEVTCLRVCKIANVRLVLAGLQREGMITSLAIYEADRFSVTEGPIREFSITQGAAQGNGSAFADVETFCCLELAYESDTSAVIVGGTRAGYFITLSLQPTTLTCISLSVKRLGIIPVSLSLIESEDPRRTAVLASSDTAIVLAEEYEEFGMMNGEFKRVSYVIPRDSNDASRAIDMTHFISVLPPGIPSKNSVLPSVLMATASSILIAQIEAKARAVPRHLPTPGSPKRVLYSQQLECLVVATFAESRPNLIFLDPLTGENISYPTTNSGAVCTLISGLGEANDRILSLKEWVYEKDGSTFLFYLIGLKSQKLLIVSVARIGHPSNPEKSVIKYWTRHKIRGGYGSVYSVFASGQDIFYCSGTMFCWDSLSSDKKIKRIAVREMPSAVLSIERFKHDIVLMTSSHSIFVLAPTRCLNGEAGFKTVHTDPKSMLSTCLISVGPEDGAGSPYPITLFADREQSVSGRWMPLADGTEIKPVFEASLSASVRKFCRGRTQPSWWHRQFAPRFGRIASTIDDAEIFGVSLDGTIEHFTLLDNNAWCFLSLVQKMAQHNAVVCPFTCLEPDSIATMTVTDLMPLSTMPALMHIDGNIIQRCVDRNAVEQCFFTEASRELMLQLLMKLDNGQWTAPILAEQDSQKREDMCFKLAYTVLEYYLRPVL